MLTIDVRDDNASGNWSAAAMIEENKRAMRALNSTAQKAAAEIKADMPRRFSIRQKWVQKGIRVDKALANNLEVRVYSIDPYMVKQEEGESYKPDGHVAIPKAARPSAGSLIPRSMFPNALRKNKYVFAFDFSRNPAWRPFPHRGIFQRVEFPGFRRVFS